VNYLIGGGKKMIRITKVSVGNKRLIGKKEWDVMKGIESHLKARGVRANLIQVGSSSSGWARNKSR
jgi:hypothetical protein